MPNQLNNFSKGYFFFMGYLYPFSVILIMSLLKMQIPTEYGANCIVLAVSVGLATIGVCVFGAVYFGSRTFLFLSGFSAEEENERL